MSAAPSSEKPGKTRLLPFGFAIVAAFAVGVVLFGRGPDLVPLPDMVMMPVTLSNNRVIHVQRFEVTIAEWDACVTQGGCSLTLRARPDQDASKTPATGISYVDVQQYIDWLNKNTDHKFRLPTMSEWVEMSAAVMPEESDPIFTDPSLTWASAYLLESNTSRALKPQGSFSTSPEGVADLDGSVWEWTQECYAGSTNVQDIARCPAFYVGGEHVAAMSYLIRDPARGGCAVGSPPAHLGMRLVSDEAT